MKKHKGFSLIELLIVVAIILIIAAIAIPNLLKARISANESSAVGSVRTLNTANVQYSAHCPRKVPVRIGSIHMVLTWFGMTSVLPFNCGIQKLCTTSTDSRRSDVGRRSVGSLTGTCSSLAVTRPRSG